MVPSQGGEQGVQVRLGGQPGDRGEGGIDDVAAGLGGHQQHGAAVAGGVVGVQVDGDADLVLEGLDQLLGGEGLEQPGHVLDGQDVGAHLLQFLGQVDVVGEGVLVALGIEDVAGVAHGRLADGAGLAHGVHGHPHPLGPVERVEDAEDVDAALGRLLDELLDDVVGVVGVADGVGGRAAASGNRCWGSSSAAGRGAPRGPRCRKRMATSKVAPPHISREKRPPPRWLVASAMRSRSKVRKRVAISDWWASRMVVSVISSFFCLRAHSASPSGPFSSRMSRLPRGRTAS